MKINIFIHTTLTVNGYTKYSIIFRGVWEDIIKMNLRKLGCDDVVCNSVGQDRAH